MNEREQTEGEKKLSQLLGEYMEEKKKNPEGFLEISTALMTGGKAGDLYMISKQFGFIKWLVENDKIEGETIGNYQSRTKLRTLTHTAGLWHDAEGKSELEYIKEAFTDGLLMLLAISENPIEDLISYLK